MEQISAAQFKAMTAKKPKSKYGAKKTVVDGITFDSAKEAKRYGELKALQCAGKISDLDLQPKFECLVNGVLVCNYIADFSYIEEGSVVVEDVKGKKTRDYIIKAKLVRACLGIVIKET